MVSLGVRPNVSFPSEVGNGLAMLSAWRSVGTYQGNELTRSLYQCTGTYGHSRLSSLSHRGLIQA